MQGGDQARSVAQPLRARVPERAAGSLVRGAPARRALPQVSRAPVIDITQPLALLTEESEHQLAVLRRALKRTAGFALYVVVARDLGRAEALRRLRAWSGLSGV